MEGLYILDEYKKPIEFLIESISDLQKWAEFMDSEASVVKKDQMTDVYVCTTFLGIDRTKGKARPDFFETQICHRGRVITSKKSATYEKALELHNNVLKISDAIDTIHNVFNEK